MKSPMAVRALSLLVVVFFAATGCTDDETEPREPGGAGGPSTGGGSPGNTGESDADVDTADAADAESDIDVRQICELEPSDAHTDFRFPCCFTDEDCRTSDAPDAEDMVCYHAVCAEGGEGICRVPPDPELRCWGAQDCPEDHSCPYEQTYQQFSCESPNIQELPDFCVDESDSD